MDGFLVPTGDRRGQHLHVSIGWVRFTGGAVIGLGIVYAVTALGVPAD